MLKRHGQMIIDLEGLPPAPEPSRTEIMVRGLVYFVLTAIAGATLYDCLLR